MFLEERACQPRLHAGWEQSVLQLAQKLLHQAHLQTVCRLYGLQIIHRGRPYDAGRKCCIQRSMCGELQELTCQVWLKPFTRT